MSQCLYSHSHFPALQMLSDTIVQHTSRYIKPNQTIPEWVYNLPEPSRSKKIASVQKYVWEEFETHLTVGYDELASVEERRDVLLERTVEYDLMVIDLKEGVDHEKKDSSRWEDESGNDVDDKNNDGRYDPLSS